MQIRATDRLLNDTAAEQNIKKHLDELKTQATNYLNSLSSTLNGGYSDFNTAVKTCLNERTDKQLAEFKDELKAFAAASPRTAISQLSPYGKQLDAAHHFTLSIDDWSLPLHFQKLTYLIARSKLLKDAENVQNPEAHKLLPVTRRLAKLAKASQICDEVALLIEFYADPDYASMLDTFKSFLHATTTTTTITQPRYTDKTADTSAGAEFLKRLEVLLAQVIREYAELRLPKDAAATKAAFIEAVKAARHQYQPTLLDSEATASNKAARLAELDGLLTPQNEQIPDVDTIKNLIATPEFQSAIKAENTVTYLKSLGFMFATPSQVFVDELKRQVTLYDERMKAFAPAVMNANSRV